MSVTWGFKLEGPCAFWTFWGWVCPKVSRWIEFPGHAPDHLRLVAICSASSAQLGSNFRSQGYHGIEGQYPQTGYVYMWSHWSNIGIWNHWSILEFCLVIIDIGVPWWWEHEEHSQSRSAANWDRQWSQAGWLSTSPDPVQAQEIALLKGLKLHKEDAAWCCDVFLTNLMQLGTA